MPIRSQLKVANEVWLATAQLHKSQPTASHLKAVVDSFENPILLTLRGQVRK